MITDSILMSLYNALSGLIDLIPSIDFTLPVNTFDLLKSTFDCLGFLLPVAAISPIVVYILAREAFRVSYAVWLVIKSYIPTIAGG